MSIVDPGMAVLGVGQGKNDRQKAMAAGNVFEAPREAGVDTSAVFELRFGERVVIEN